MSCSYYTFRSGSYYCMKKSDYINDDVYYKYCRGYDYSDCPIYKDEPASGCYLTSACVLAKGLPDDCYELATLRKYRDSWLSEQPECKSIIAKYYEIAPKIVAAIDKLENHKVIYEAIYEKMIAPCIALIEAGKMQETLALYRDMTLQLEEEYCYVTRG